MVSALIVYGSLFPFDFAMPADFQSRLLTLLADWRLFSSRGDVLGNILLFVPLGLLCALARTAHPLRAHLLHLGWATALALGCQVAQIFVPARTAAMSDVIWNLAGQLLGMGMGMGASRYLRAGTQTHSWALGLGAITAWLAAELVPLVPTLSLSSMRDNLAGLFDPSFSWSNAATAMAGMLYVGTVLDTLLGPTRTRWCLRMLMACIVVGKVLVLSTGLNAGTCAGLLLGYGGYHLVRTRLGAENLTTAAMVTIWLAITLRALVPFSFASVENEWHWVPFAGLLKGSMLANVQSLVQSLFLYGALLSLVAFNRLHVLSSSIVLAFWVLALEIVQIWIDGRSGDISEPLLVILVGIAIKAAAPLFVKNHPVARSKDDDDRARPAIPSWAWIAVELIGVCIVIAVAIGLVLSHPRIPYNVSELFLADGSFPARLAFAFAVLWTGLGAALLARAVERFRFPLLVWPLATAGAAIVGLMLMSLGVTQESITDIAGSNNLYWFVTHQDIWGSAARSLFLTLDSPKLIAFFERPVRYTALCGPLFIGLAFTQLWASNPSGRSLTRRRLALIVLSSLPWLWLFKGIAFDWSSTDNLNELIARDGHWGWGGGGYLYLLLLTIAASAAVVANVRAHASAAATAAITLVLAVPVGWWLLNAGLEPNVEKYGKVYSGVQFLLGPDRSTRITAIDLLLRWSLVQTVAILLLAEGLRIGRLILARLENHPR